VSTNEGQINIKRWTVIGGGNNVASKQQGKAISWLEKAAGRGPGGQLLISSQNRYIKISIAIS
jgi:hypothetical protein